MSKCYVCDSSEVIELINFGAQPICNRFLKSSDEQEYKHPLVLGLCNACGLVQLIDSFPSIELRPLYNWITYNEPENHLDKLAGILSNLSNLNKNSALCGISFKDDTILERMKKHGFSKIKRLDPKEDLGIMDGWTGVETIQDRFNHEKAKAIVNKSGKFDLIIVRHILEHAYDLPEFMRSLKELLNPDGYVMFEVPDCTKSLEYFDYSSIWEEHTMYFTPYTFRNCLTLIGFSIEHFEIFPYSLENCLVAILKPTKFIKTSFHNKNSLQNEKNRAIAFSQGFSYKKTLIKSFFSEYKANTGKIAFFGAGHTAIIFINIFELRDYIECVIDDNKNKHGLFMPGSHLPIIGSSALEKKNIKLSVLSLNPDFEEKIVEKNGRFVENGGEFLSIVPTSKLPLYHQLKTISSEDLHLSKFNNEVYYAMDNIIKIGKTEIDWLKEKSMDNERKRCRICAHKDIDEKVHEMFIIHTKDTYVRPHKHINKNESLYVIEGSADVIIFDEMGNINEVIPMGDYLSGRKFFYRINDPHYHTLHITSKFLIFHETIKGPFNKGDATFAPWAPDENDCKAIEEFIEELERAKTKFLLIKKDHKNQLEST